MSDFANALHVAGTQLESFGAGVVAKFGALNVWTLALLAGAMVLDRALARRARASWRLMLYAPIALRILLPLDWSIHVATAPRLVTFLAPLTRITAASSGGAPSTWQALSWHTLAAVAYVAIAAALAACAIVARVRLRRALSGASLVVDLRADVPCPVVAHDHLGPMAVGLLSPRIVLPRRLLDPHEENALGCVLRHEVAHLRRGDAWLSAAMQLLAVAAWPVVPLWIAIARVRQLVELACDEAAVAGADATERRRYGHALLDIAEWRPLAATTLGAGELHFGSTLRARIEALASQRHWSPGVQALVFSLAPVVLLVACSGSTALPAPASANDADDYGYRFETDGLKSAATTSTSEEKVALSPDGRLAPEAVQSTVRSRFSAMSACYEAGVRRDPKLAGTVTVRFVFGEDGIVKEATDDGSTLPDTGVIACVVGEFRKMTFAKTNGNVTVVYPVELAP